MVTVCGESNGSGGLGRSQSDMGIPGRYPQRAATSLSQTMETGTHTRKTNTQKMQKEVFWLFFPQPYFQVLCSCS